jgi:hypothetical protein
MEPGDPIEATAWGPVSWQLPIQLGRGLYRVPLDDLVENEDCLNLNVWSPGPRPDGPLPVLVWLHGGNRVYSSASSWIDPWHFAARHGAIVITTNYRLGLQRSAEAFGGDLREVYDAIRMRCYASNQDHLLPVSRYVNLLPSEIANKNDCLPRRLGPAHLIVGLSHGSCQPKFPRLRRLQDRRRTAPLGSAGGHRGRVLAVGHLAEVAARRTVDRGAGQIAGRVVEPLATYDLERLIGADRPGARPGPSWNPDCGTVPSSSVKRRRVRSVRWCQLVTPSRRRWTGVV